MYYNNLSTITKLPVSEPYSPIVYISPIVKCFSQTVYGTPNFRDSNHFIMTQTRSISYYTQISYKDIHLFSQYVSTDSSYTRCVRKVSSVRG